MVHERTVTDGIREVVKWMSLRCDFMETETEGLHYSALMLRGLLELKVNMTTRPLQANQRFCQLVCHFENWKVLSNYSPQNTLHVLFVLFMYLFGPLGACCACCNLVLKELICCNWVPCHSIDFSSLFLGTLVRLEETSRDETKYVTVLGGHYCRCHLYLITACIVADQEHHKSKTA